MKFIYIAFSLVLLFSCGSAKKTTQNSDASTTKHQNLRIVKGYMYQVEQNQITSDTVLSALKWYDESNKLAKEERYWIGEEGKNIERIIYTKNQDVKKKEYILNDSSFFQSSEFERDEYNQLLRQILTNNEEVKTINQENIYDKNGNLIETIGRFEGVPKEFAKKYASYTKNKYDKKGNLIELTQAMGKEKIRLITYKYDKNNNLIEELSLDFKTDEKFKLIYSYNDENQVIKKEVYQNEEWDFTTETEWQNGIIKTQKTYYAPFTKEEYHEVTFFEVK
ncbi:hypothetical protein ACE193_22895 [Bernardetia sp. OM2101]|uniref:hypothetical protein n=1 Tax=Bernardetia sp. OM2101 TaxID=3344876 RepID=UPI0035CFCA6C